jgi:hypothetical protein
MWWTKGMVLLVDRFVFDLDFTAQNNRLPDEYLFHKPKDRSGSRLMLPASSVMKRRRDLGVSA